MFCTNCGAELTNDATQCSNCGATVTPYQAGPYQGNPYQANPYQDGPTPPQFGYGQRPNIPTYLAQAILVTLFCCMPFGVVAIVYSAQVDGKLASGDFAGAQRSSDSAKMWCWLSFGCWFVVPIVYVFMFAAADFRR